MRKEINQLKAFDEELHCVNVVIETPKGSCVKYSYMKEIGFFHLKKALPEGMTFPYNFGFIPSTEGDDGDPLDVLILNEEPLFPGCLVKARLAGAIKAEQKEDGKTIRNDRLFAFALSKETPTSLDTVEVNKKKLDEIEYFFKSYNKLEGKKFKALGKVGVKQAVALVKKGEKIFARKQQDGEE